MLFLSRNYLLGFYNGDLLITTRNFTLGWLNSYRLPSALTCSFIVQYNPSKECSWSRSFVFSPSPDFYCDHLLFVHSCTCLSLFFSCLLLLLYVFDVYLSVYLCRVYYVHIGFCSAPFRYVFIIYLFFARSWSLFLKILVIIFI